MVQLCSIIHSLKAFFTVWFYITLKLLECQCIIIIRYVLLFNTFYNQDIMSTFAFTRKSIYLPRTMATFVFSEQKGGVLLTGSNVYREIILASSCFMKIATAQLLWLFL